MITQRMIEMRRENEISKVSGILDINVKASKIGKIRFKYSNISVMLAAKAARKNKQDQFHALSVAMWCLAKSVHGHILTGPCGIKYSN